MTAVASDPGQGALRVVRTLLIAVPSATLGAAAHSLGGGCLTLWSIALAAGVIVPATWTQLERERSLAFLISWLAVGQLLCHSVLELGCHSAHHRDAGVGMLLLHAGAVLATAVLLRREEARSWAAARWLAAVLRRRPALLVPRVALPRPRASFPTPAPWRHSIWSSPSPVRRGPPVRRRRYA